MKENNLDIICKTIEIIERYKEDLEDSEDIFHPVEYVKRIEQVYICMDFLQNLKSNTDLDLNTYWYTEKWSRQDIDAVLTKEGFSLLEDTIISIEESLKALFSKTDRQGTLSQAVRNILLMRKIKRQEEAKQYAEISLPQSISEKAAEIYAKMPIRVYRGLDADSNSYYVTVFDFQEPSKIGNLDDLESWLYTWLTDEGNVPNPDDIIEVYKKENMLIGFKNGEYYKVKEG